MKARVKNQFVLMLHREYERRQLNNSRYSKRAFAKDLKISKSCLHDLLVSKTEPSIKTIDQICDSLKLSGSDRKALLEKKYEPKLITAKDQSEIFHWHYFALLNLIETKNSSTDAGVLAKRLGLTKAVVGKALKDLERYNLIVKQGDKYVRAVESVITTEGIPSHYIKSLHAENLKRAERSLFEDDINHREMMSLTFAINKDQYKKILKENKKHRDRVIKITLEEGDKDEVYTFSMQLFPQTIIKEKK